MGLFRVLLPAILLHGSYDFAIMIISYLQALYADPDDVTSIIVYNIIAMAFSVGFVIFGFIYYIIQSHKQVARLDRIEKARTFVGIPA
jgi:F0F1-type ATP synthase membrane subunit c/vacuolar-type H+-ATPase subunit K